VALAYTFFLSEPWAIPWWARLIEGAPLAVGAAGWVARQTRGLGAPERTL
jgi:hypothetical protein